jgi:hypothetical protein
VISRRQEPYLSDSKLLTVDHTLGVPPPPPDLGGANFGGGRTVGSERRADIGGATTGGDDEGTGPTGATTDGGQHRSYQGQARSSGGGCC